MPGGDEATVLRGLLGDPGMVALIVKTEMTDRGPAGGTPWGRCPGRGNG